MIDWLGIGGLERGGLPGLRVVGDGWGIGTEEGFWRGGTGRGVLCNWLSMVAGAGDRASSGRERYIEGGDNALEG